MGASGCFVWSLVLVIVTAAIADEDKTFWMEAAQRTLRMALAQRPNIKVARNVILFLGDGMGVSTVTAARIYKGQKAGKTGEENVLSFESFPNVALSKTYNTDKQVADSAGTGTAFLCGVKANYGTLGVDNRVARGNCTPFYNTDTHTSSILKWSIEEGKSTGVVTTTRLTHATPASSYAHIPDRNWEKDTDIPPSCPGVKDIAFQMLRNGTDIKVMLGGGKQEFINRQDGLDLPEEWRAEKTEQGSRARYVQNATDFRAVDVSDTDYLLGLFTDGHMAYEIDRDNASEPSIAEMTRKAIEILGKNEKGFFLLVEGGRIDHGHHDNWAKKALEDTAAFDDAVAVAKEITGDDTLIVVTADHSHVFNIAGYPSRGNPLLGLVDEEREIYIPTDGQPYTTLVYGNGPGPNRTTEDLNDVDTTAKEYRFQRAVPMKEGYETHAGEDVAIFASGPMAHLFHGVHEQNYIAHVMAYASCVGPNKQHCQEPVLDPCTGSAARLVFAKELYLVVWVFVFVFAFRRH